MQFRGLYFNWGFMNLIFPVGEGSFFGRVLKGQLPLWKAFWLVFMPVPFVLYLAYIGTLWAWVWLNPMGHVWVITLIFTTVSFLLVAAVGTIAWRSSGNTSQRIWSYLARLVIAIYLLWYGRRVLIHWWFLSASGIL